MTKQQQKAAPDKGIGQSLSLTSLCVIRSSRAGQAATRKNKHPQLGKDSQAVLPAMQSRCPRTAADECTWQQAKVVVRNLIRANPQDYSCSGCGWHTQKPRQSAVQPCLTASHAGLDVLLDNVYLAGTRNDTVPSII